MRSGMLTLRIDSRLDHVFLVGLSVRAICAAAALPADEAAAVELCVVEAVNNAVEHAYREEPGHIVEIELALQMNGLSIKVRDRGLAMDWVAARRNADAYAVDPLNEGGRGLFIMRSVMDSLSYRSANGWNVLTMVKRVPAATPAAKELRRSS